MKKELCFIIDGQELYLEKVLVDYMEVPIFFLCKAGEKYYIALCIDMDEYNYVVVQMTMQDTYDLLHGKIPMRDVILGRKEYWLVCSGDEPKDDKVEKQEIGRLQVELLPKKGACFQILTEDMEKYVQAFDEYYFSNDNFATEKLCTLSEKAMAECGEMVNEIIDSITVFSEVANCKFNMSCKSENTAIQYDEIMESCFCETVKNEKFCWENLEYNVLAA